MLVSALKEFDSSVNILKASNEQHAEGMCHPLNPFESHFFIIKNKKFFLEVLKSVDHHDLKNCGALFEKGYFDQEKPDTSKFSWHGTVAHADLCMSHLSRHFYQIKYPDLNEEVDGRQMGSVDIDPTARIAQNVFIAEDCKIAANVKIMPGCVVMNNVTIEEGTVLFPNVTIYKDTQIGKGCRIHSGVVIGSDGFGYNFDQGVHHKVWHLYSALIGDHVEIGSNSAIDGGVFFPTKIGNGSKIDNLVQIGHNSIIGNGVIICGQAGLGGSAKAGNYSMLGGRAMIGPGFTIGNQVLVAGNSGVTHNWGDKHQLAGYPAQEVKSWMRDQAILRRLIKAQQK